MNIVFSRIKIVYIVFLNDFKKEKPRLYIGKKMQEKHKHTLTKKKKRRVSGVLRALKCGYCLYCKEVQKL